MRKLSLALAVIGAMQAPMITQVDARLFEHEFPGAYDLKNPSFPLPKHNSQKHFIKPHRGYFIHRQFRRLL
jgi:hypothetical protein